MAKTINSIAISQKLLRTYAGSGELREVMMQRLRVQCFSISVDGYGAGPNQSLENPLGVGGDASHEWLVHTRTFQQTHGGDGGPTGIDDDFAARVTANVGAWIIGRNMFAPSRGPWPDDSWRGWWGENPPFTRPCTCSPHTRAARSS